jgi:hypothetical protein
VTPTPTPEAIQRVLVCGGRDFDDELAMLTELLKVADPRHVLVHGDAPGADRLAAKCWRQAGFADEPHPAQWDKFGKAAGAIRNQEMLESGIDLVLAFPGGRGTADMVRRARRAGVEVREVLP